TNAKDGFGERGLVESVTAVQGEVTFGVEEIHQIMIFCTRRKPNTLPKKENSIYYIQPTTIWRKLKCHSSLN
ncbi:hypothetical protein NL312_32910, partial [Klebsiella pneumoniae]|nr:hypothetical protein [Klebsiella pneumoniae]